MRIEEKIGKYLVNEAEQKFDIHPTRLDRLLKSGLNVTKIELVLRPRDFLSKDDIQQSKKMADKLKRGVGQGVTIRKIKNDMSVFDIDPKKVDIKKLNKWYDTLDELGSGMIDVDALLFAYIDGVSKDDLKVLGFEIQRRPINYMG